MLITNVNRNEIVFVGDMATGAKTNLIWALKNGKGSINYVKQTGVNLHVTIGSNYAMKEINKVNSNIRYIHLLLLVKDYYLPNHQIHCYLKMKDILNYVTQNFV